MIFAALNIAMVAVGSDALDACPLDPMIPIYLVGESFYIFSIQLIIYRIFFNQNITQNNKSLSNLSLENLDDLILLEQFCQFDVKLRSNN